MKKITILITPLLVIAIGVLGPNVTAGALSPFSGTNMGVCNVGDNNTLLGNWQMFSCQTVVSSTATAVHIFEASPSYGGSNYNLGLGQGTYSLTSTLSSNHCPGSGSFAYNKALFYGNWGSGATNTVPTNMCWYAEPCVSTLCIGSAVPAGFMWVYGLDDITGVTLGAVSGSYRSAAIQGFFFCTTSWTKYSTWRGTTYPCNIPSTTITSNSATCAGTGWGASASPSTFIEDNTTSYAYPIEWDVSCQSSNNNPSYPAYPSTFYTGGTSTPPTPPCSLTGATGQWQGNASTNTNYPVNIEYAGGASILAVDPQDGSTPTQTVKGQTFSANTQFDYSPSSPDTLNYQEVAGQTLNPELWCYDGSGWVDWGPLSLTNNSNQPTSNGGGSFDLTTCFGQSGMSLYNPVSWVTGAWHDGTCILQWLFIPNNNTVTALTSTLSSKQPISDITDAVNATTTFVSAINTSVGTGGCSPPHIQPFSMSSGYLATLNGSFNFYLPVPADVCSGTLPSYDTTVGEVFGYRTWLRTIEALGIWLSTLAILWRMMPWSMAGDGVDVVTAIAHVDGYTLYSDHTATKDGGYSE